MVRKWTMPLALALLVPFPGAGVAGSLAAQQQPPARQPQPEAGAPDVRARVPGMGPGLQMAPYAPQHLVDRREVLGLTPEQVSRLEALAQEAKQASDKAEAEAKTQWDQLAELWKQATPDASQVRSHAQAAMQAMQGARVAHLVAAAQSKAVLTPEQRGRVAGWADGNRMRMRERMGRMDRMGQMGRMPMRRPLRIRRPGPPDLER